MTSHYFPDLVPIILSTSAVCGIQLLCWFYQCRVSVGLRNAIDELVASETVAVTGPTTTGGATGGYQL